jgi:hypothetical protein
LTPVPAAASQVAGSGKPSAMPWAPAPRTEGQSTPARGAAACPDAPATALTTHEVTSKARRRIMKSLLDDNRGGH